MIFVCLQHFHHVLTSMRRPQGRGLELARKHIASCMLELDSIHRSAEFLRANVYKTCKEALEDRTTGSGCEPIGFDASLNCRLSAPTPPRAIKILSWIKVSAQSKLIYLAFSWKMKLSVFWVSTTRLLNISKNFFMILTLYVQIPWTRHLKVFYALWLSSKSFSLIWWQELISRSFT